MIETFKKYNAMQHRYLPKIEQYGLQLESLSDHDLKERIQDVRQRLRAEVANAYKDHDGKSAKRIDARSLLLAYLPEVYALVRETSHRILGMRHYDVQLVGGIAMHLGNIAQLKNGEGKTIVALLPACLNALYVRAEYDVRIAKDPNFAKRSVHIITSNPYLARRDFVWMRDLYAYWDITVGYLQEDNIDSHYMMGASERKSMYQAEVIYSSGKQMMFDYLRDQLIHQKKDQVQRGYYFLIVDEADHLLLDEARTPHIISSNQGEDAFEDLELVYLVNNLVSRMTRAERLIAMDQHRTLRLTGSGQTAIHILVSQTLKKLPNLEGHSQFPDRLHIIAFILQLTNNIVNRAVVDNFKGWNYAVVGQLGVLSYQTESTIRFFDRNKDGQITNLSKEGRAYILSLLRIEETDELIDSLRQLITILPRLLRIMPRYGAEIARYGIRREELVTYSKKLRSDLLRYVVGSLRSDVSLFNLFIDVIEDYVVELSKVRIESTTMLNRFVTAMTILAESVLLFYPHGDMPKDMLSQLRQLRNGIVHLNLDEEKIKQAFLSDATIDIFETLILSAVTNMLNPEKNSQSIRVSTVLVLIALRAIGDAFSVQKPRTRHERELSEMTKLVGGIASLRLYNVDIDNQIQLSYWGRLIVSDYARQIVENGLWSGEVEVKDPTVLQAALEPRLFSFVDKSLSAYLAHKLNEHYIITKPRFQSTDNFTGRPIQHEISIIGRLTGRVMPGRRWSRWLHSFIEAKHGIPVRQDNRSRATISTVGYVSMYPYMAGMSGTATVGKVPTWFAVMNRTTKFVQRLWKFIRRKPINIVDEPMLTYDPVELEFENVYGTGVIVVPQNRSLKREDESDRLYSSERARLLHAAELALETVKTGRPVLVETNSVERSQWFAEYLQKRVKNQKLDVKINLLNALTEEQEAHIISNAGLPNTITVATQIAGRGTDIILSSESIEKDGLYVIAFERRMSRRWDNQISGRAGRQGEPGTSVFLVTYDDQLIKNFVADNMANMIKNMFGDEDVEIGSSQFLTASLKSAQIRFEHFSRSQRERTAEYDRIVGQFRDIVYRLRQQSLGETHICVSCGGTLVNNNAETPFCDACLEYAAKYNLDLLNQLPLWRHYFDDVVLQMVDDYIGNARLEKYLVEKYTNPTTPPSQWNFRAICAEMNEIFQPHGNISENNLVQDLDLANELYPEAEQKQLRMNIREALIATHVSMFMNRAHKIIKRYGQQHGKNVTSWRDDVWEKFAHELVEHTQIGLKPQVVYIKGRMSDERDSSLNGLTETIKQLITENAKQQNWLSGVPVDIQRLQAGLNPVLAHGLQITEAELQQHLARGKVAMLVQERLVKTYKTLIDKYGKADVYAYENGILREIIDEMWPKMLTDAENLAEDFQTEDVRADLMKFGVRVAQHYQLMRQDLARSFVRRLFGEIHETFAVAQEVPQPEPNIRR